MEITKTYDRYAIFQKGLKQYQAVEGKTLAIDQLSGKPGDVVEFPEVLFRKMGEGKYEIGQPFLGNKVTATIVKHMQGPKKIALRFKRRKKLHVSNNSRPALTVIRIESI